MMHWLKTGIRRTSLWLTTECRAVARRIGLRSVRYRLQSAGLLPRAVPREEKFERALLAAIRPGDVVWDIGANVGHYTTRFANAVGPGGRVVAVEPAPACYSALARATADSPNIVLLPIALSDRDGAGTLAEDGDPLGTTHHLTREPGAGSVVRVATGDALIAQDGAPRPNVLKIDVEGFEQEVLRGLGETVSHAECRAIFCEIHFGILDAAGRRHAPAEIESSLEKVGFVTRWVDGSHLEAVKPPCR